MNAFNPLQRDKNPTATALFGVAAILILVGSLAWFMYGERFGWVDWLVASSGGLYLLLGLAARRVRVPAVLLGILLFAAYLGFQAFHDANLLFAGWIIKGPVAALLLLALFSALKKSRGQEGQP